MDSFYTISSRDDLTDRTTLTTPSPTTHDTSRASYHISDISSFAENLQDAANRAFPNRGQSRYKTVNVCLIRWQEDELQVKSEVDRLFHVFEKLYGFNTQIWLIPPRASQIQLTSMTCSFIQEFDAEDNLFIVYYGGHGTINQSRQNQWWSGREPGSASVDWSAIQALFATAVSDVLVLLDCCAAASSAFGSGGNVMEAVAACGFETRSPPPGIYSFTHTLIEVLEDWVNKPSFSAAMLHTEVLFVLKQKRPERGRDGRRLEWCSTPIHFVYTGNPKSPGIELCCLKSTKSAQKLNTRFASQRPTRSTAYVDSMDLDDDSFSDALSACTVEGTYQVPHVLLSIALEEDQADLDAASCRRWLSDFPALVKYATVEGVYRGNSTLITMSLPVMVWDMLPENRACSFIGFVNTPNKFSQSFSLADIRNMYLQMLPEQDRGKLGTIRDPHIPSVEARSRPIPVSKRLRSLSRDSSYESDYSFVSSTYISQSLTAAKKSIRKTGKSKMFTLGGSSGSESDVPKSSSPNRQARPKEEVTTTQAQECELTDDGAFDTDSSESYGELIDTDNSSDRGASTEDSQDANVNEKTLFQRVESGTKRNSPESLITTMLNQDNRARAHTDAAANSSRSCPRPIIARANADCRREMLTQELSTSLRQHLLRERSQRSQTVLKRRHSDIGALKQQAEKAAIDGGISDNGDTLLDEGVGGYHSKGW